MNTRRNITNFYRMVTRNRAEEIGAEMAGIKKEYVIMSKFTPVPFAEQLMKTTKFIYDSNGIFWRCGDDGLWSNDAEQVVKTELRTQLMGDEQQKKNYVEEIIAYLKDFNYNKDFKMDSCPYLIPLEDKVFDIRTGELLDYAPEMYLSHKLDRELDPTITECHRIDKFFEESVGVEYKDMLYEVLAYSLFKEIPYQKLFFIYGPAGTGKSIFMTLFERFIGHKNFSAVEPKRLQKDPHATSQMEFKYANIVSDINYDEFENINQVKKLTGGDTVTIRRLYKNPYDTKIFAKQIYSTNKLPVVKEKTKAWYRRVYLITFANVIPAEGRDLFLLQKLLTEEELKGLTYKCLKKLQELYKNNFVFTWDMDEDKMQDIYEELSNPLLMFIRDNCTEGRENWVFKWEFEERLNNWLKNNHFPTSTKSEINKYMREKYTESQRPAFNGGKIYRVWSGLKWREAGENDPLNGFNHFTYKIKIVYRKGKKLLDPVNPLKPLNPGSKPNNSAENLVEKAIKPVFEAVEEVNK